jgi:4-amino-4-deoxy-L-arabinose transferase-like glycosyltransferase
MDGTPALRRRRTVHAALCVTFVAMVTFLAGLGRYSLWEPDEARYAQIARELLEGPTRLTPTFYGHPYYDKPILYYWLTAAAYDVGGTTTAMARTVSAISAILTVVAVFAWARVAWGIGAALLAALVLLSSVEFVALGRYGDLNMLLTLWTTVGMLAEHRWASREGRGLGLTVAAVACGLGALTKGLVTPVLVGGVGLVHLGRTGRLHLLRRPHTWLAAIAFVAVAAPWYVSAGLRSPEYIREFLVDHHLRRALGGDAFPGGTANLHPAPVYFSVLGCRPASMDAAVARDARGRAPKPARRGDRVLPRVGCCGRPALHAVGRQARDVRAASHAAARADARPIL